MLKDYGLVSIVMPNYNCGKFLRATVESVIAQTYENWELLFVDDCSNDDSLEIINSFADERIRVLKNEKNSGAAVSRNVAIDAAEGRWIAFLDSDDKWRKDKLENHLLFMEENDCCLSFTDYNVVIESGEVVTNYSPKKCEYDYKAILKHNSIGCSTVIYDTSKLGKVYMPTEAIKREDFACWLSILRNGNQAVCLHIPLTDYLVRGNSVSSNKFKMIKWQWNIYRKIEKLSLFRSLYYMAHWAILGVLKYR